MKWLLLGLWAAGFILFWVPAAHSKFVPTASLGIALGTTTQGETDYRLSRMGTGSCQAEILVQLTAEQDVLLEQTADSLKVSSTQDMVSIHGNLHGSCEAAKELELLYVAESSTEAVPMLLLNAPSENTFIAERDWDIEFLVLLPTKGDKIYVEGWKEHEVISAQSLPEIFAVGSWMQLKPEGWQEYWHSHLTWPEQGTDYFFAEDCHSFSQLFFSPDSVTPCQASAHSPVATRIPSIRGWYGWRVANDSLVLPSPAARSPAPGEVRITEVMWAGSFSSLNNSADEWVELFNTSDENLSLDGLQLQKAKSGGEALVFPPGLKIASQSYFVIGKPTAESLLVRPADWQTRNLSLPNTDAGLSLQTSLGVVIDSLPSGLWQAGENDIPKKLRSSAQLRHVSVPSNVWTSWSACSREDEDRCWYQTRADWKQNSAKNLASPWKASVL